MGKLNDLTGHYCQCYARCPRIERVNGRTHAVNKVVHAYNYTVNDATGFSPIFLLFGRSPRLPVDLLFGTSPSSTRENHTDYVKRWKSAMKDAYAKATSSSGKAAISGKKIYDRKVRFTLLKPGDRVLVRNLCERGGPGKLRSYWENQIYEVVEQKGALPIFVVKPEGNAKGRSRVLHRNLLLRCDFLPQDSSEDSEPVARTEKRKSKPKVHDNTRRTMPSDSDSESDHEIEYQGLSSAEIATANTTERDSTTVTWESKTQQYNIQYNTILFKHGKKSSVYKNGKYSYDK